MDPNATRQRVLKLAAEIRGTHLDDVGELAELGVDLAYAIQDLDDWITAGGFLPRAWTKEG